MVEAIPQPSPVEGPPTPKDPLDSMVDLLRSLSRATSLVDVNVAAGIALAEVLEFSAHRTEQLGELVNLVL